MFNTIITTVKMLLRRPSTWVWGALFPIALSTMFMFMFANLSSDGTVDPVPVAVVADETWDASTFKDAAASLAKESDNQLLEIHECDDAADAPLTKSPRSMSITSMPCIARSRIVAMPLMPPPITSTWADGRSISLANARRRCACPPTIGASSDCRALPSWVAGHVLATESALTAPEAHDANDVTGMRQGHPR